MKIITIILSIIIILFLSVISFFLGYTSKSVDLSQKKANSQEVLLSQSKINKFELQPTQKFENGKFYTSILLYHHITETKVQNSYYVSPQIFEKQMKWLKDNGYQAISYEKFYQALTNNGTLPMKPVVISFDDSLLDQYTNAFPILKKYGYTAIFFIKMNNIGKGALDWPKIKELVEAGMEIGSHSMNHDNMMAMSPQTMDSELQQSKKIIEENLNIPIKYFSYPGGVYNNNTISKVKEAGYFSAVTTKHEVYHSIKDNPYTVSRIHIDDEMPTFIDWVEGNNLK